MSTISIQQLTLERRMCGLRRNHGRVWISQVGDCVIGVKVLDLSLTFLDSRR
jgi:hypothetical protein